MRPAGVFLTGFAFGATALLALLIWKGAFGPIAPAASAPRVAADTADVAAPTPGPPPAAAATPFPYAPSTPFSAPPAAAGHADDALPAVSPPPAPPPVGASDLERLRARGLLFPVEGFDLSRLRDDFADPRGDRRHEALDILADRGTVVQAVDDGRVAKLFTSARGGLTVYQFDPTSTYCYYYAHLDRYAQGLKEGDFLRRGDRIGYVGTTGNAPPDTPHLHFGIFKLAPEKRWWEGVPLNPYPVWAPTTAAAAQDQRTR